MNLVTHAEAELQRAGLFDKDSDYNGMLGNSVLELMKIFSKQGHSGFSAMLTLQIFNKVANWKSLTPITNDPKEWNDVSNMSGRKNTMWQNTRQSDCFSTDGGETYYSLDDIDRLEKTFSFKVKKLYCKLTGRKFGPYLFVKPSAPSYQLGKRKVKIEKSK